MKRDYSQWLRAWVQAAPMPVGAVMDSVVVNLAMLRSLTQMALTSRINDHPSQLELELEMESSSEFPNAAGNAGSQRPPG